MRKKTFSLPDVRVSQTPPPLPLPSVRFCPVFLTLPPGGQPDVLCECPLRELEDCGIIMNPLYNFYNILRQYSVHEVF